MTHSFDGKILRYKIKLNWNEYLEDKFKSKSDLYCLFRDSLYINEQKKNGTFFGCVYNASYYLSVFNNDINDVYKINSEDVGFRIDEIYFNPTKENEIHLFITPVRPMCHHVRAEIFDAFDIVLHPRVPNLGSKEEPRFIPVTFDLILKHPEEKIENFNENVFSKLEYETLYE